jgi:drug/metabolite transporter (DMT)-like permease
LSAFASAGTWALASVLYARALRDRPAAEAVWFKNTIGAVVLIVAAIAFGAERGGGLPTLDRMPWLAVSALCSVLVGDLLYFVAIRRLGVGRAVMLSLLTPALTAIAAWPLRGEALTGLSWLGVALIVGGSAWIELGHLGRGRAETLGVAAGLGCALAWTCGNLTMSEGIEGVGMVAAGAFRLGVASLGMIALGVVRGDLLPALRRFGERESWRRFALPTFFGTVLGMLLYSGGFKWADAGPASSLGTAIPIFSLPIAWWLLGERPDRRGLLGAAIVLGGVACFGVAVQAG